MKKLIALLVLAALALVPVAAEAKGSKRAKVYRGTFVAVGADGAYTTGKFGKAHLVDGKRNDKLSVHVRRLAPKTRYAFRLQQAPQACEQNAPGGTEVPGWTYRRGGVFKTNRKGHANSKARSKTFTAQPGVEYFVGVYTLTPAGQPDQLVLCAELKRKNKPKQGGNCERGKGRGHEKGDGPRGRARGHDRQQGDRPAKPDKPAKPDEGKGKGNGQGKGKLARRCA